VKGRRLALLNERNRGIADVFKWVQANKDRFRGPVFGPLICEVGVHNPLHADMLEQSVRGAILAWLVTAELRCLHAGVKCTGWMSIACLPAGYRSGLSCPLLTSRKQGYCSLYLYIWMTSPNCKVDIWSYMLDLWCR